MSYKIAFISDIHFGVRNNSELYLEIIKNFFTKTLIKTLQDYKITDVRILGDLFDCRNNINVRTLNVVLDIFDWYQLNHPEIKFKILLGNHDIYYKNRIDVNSVNVLRNFYNVSIINKVTIENIKNKSIITYPWMISNSNESLHFLNIPDSDKKYDLCLGHFEVKGFEISKGIVDIDNLDIKFFRNYKKVFTGHYHLKNTLENISYLGCPYQLDWGDYGDDKGINIWDLEKEEHIFVKNENSPEFIKIQIDDIQNKNLQLLKRIKGNHIKFVINKKMDDSWIIKARAKIESMEPLTFEVENNIIETTIDDSDLDLSKINDPFNLLMECVNNIGIDKDIDKNELKAYLIDIYSKSLKESD